MNSAQRLSMCMVFGSFAALAASAAAGTSVAKGQDSVDPVQAREDYILKCQGCHRPDGTGDINTTPPLAGYAARFLSVPGGREYLVRVPGVATTNLSDARVTNLLNWMLGRFDAAHLPGDFEPYQIEEVARLRGQPLRLERSAVRARLAEQIHDRSRRK
jgi:mono/diheme cytochrome c family protein